MTWKNFLVSVLVLSIGFLLHAASPVAQAQGSATKLRGTIVFATLRIGSAGHASATALAEVLKDTAGLNVRVVPCDAEKPRVNLLRTGSAHCAILPGSAMYYLQLGLEDYAVKGWGPQSIQMAWLGPAYLGMLTTKAHRDINRVEDIKGKRIAVLPHKSTVLLAQAFINFAGLTWDDVVRVTVPGYTAQFKALMAGQVDVVPIANPVTSVLYEVEASPKGLKWLPFPHENKQGWDRLRRVAPWGVPAKVTIGPGLSEKNPLDAYMHAYAFVVYDWADPGLVYLITKTIAENLDRLKSLSGAWKVYTMELATRTEGFPHVYHRGAIKYFKEKGLWSHRHEQWNNRQIALQNRLKDAWDAFIKKAEAQNWKPEDIRKRWHRTQAEITGYEISD